jgi:ribosomal protein L37E
VDAAPDEAERRDEMPAYHVECKECGLSYNQTRDPEPEICGACGSPRIEVWKRVREAW